MFLCAVNTSVLLTSFRGPCVTVVRKVAEVTPTFVGCACCADRSEHLPRRRSVLAPVCLWKYLFCTKVGRDRRWEGWRRRTVFAHVEIIGFFFIINAYMDEVDPENLSASLLLVKSCVNEAH